MSDSHINIIMTAINYKFKQKFKFYNSSPTHFENYTQKIVKKNFNSIANHQFQFNILIALSLWGYKINLFVQKLVQNNNELSVTIINYYVKNTPIKI